MQREIKELEFEKLSGKREIDAVDAEIRSKQLEIANLNRKHFNYFYYF